MFNTNTPIKPLLLKRKEAAKLLNISETTLDRSRKRNQLPHVKFPTGAVRYRISDILMFIDQQTISGNLIRSGTKLGKKSTEIAPNFKHFDNSQKEESIVEESEDENDENFFFDGEL